MFFFFENQILNKEQAPSSFTSAVNGDPDIVVNRKVDNADKSNSQKKQAPSSFTSAVNGDPDIVVNRKVDNVDKCVVLHCTCAVRVIKPDTGKTTLAYAQLDTASQATLISEKL